MLDLINDLGILLLILNVEYTILLIYILTKMRLIPLKLRSYLFCFFTALICVVRVIRETLLILEKYEDLEVFLNSCGFCVYFTIISLIAKTWHVKYIKNSFSIPVEEKPRLKRQAWLYFLYANIFIYSGFLVLCILLLQEVFSKFTHDQISLNIYIFRILGKLILTFGLTTGGIRLLKTINSIYNIKPAKLRLYVYLNIGISVWTILPLVIYIILFLERRLYSTNPDV